MVIHRIYLGIPRRSEEGQKFLTNNSTQFASRGSAHEPQRTNKQTSPGRSRRLGRLGGRGRPDWTIAGGARGRPGNARRL